MRLSRLTTTIVFGVLAVTAASLGALAGLCDLGARLTDVVGIRMTLLAGQMEEHRGGLVAASAALLAPAIWIGRRGLSLPGDVDDPGVSRSTRTVMWIAAGLVVAAALLPWVVHRTIG